MISGIHHTGVVVGDLDLLQRFYIDVIGMRLIGTIDSVAPPEGNHTGIEGSRRKLVFLGFGSGENERMFELVHFIQPAATNGHLGKLQCGASHLCFSVDDLQSEYARLSAAGVKFETEPKFSDTAAGRLGVVYARDPEGNWLELIEGSVTFSQS